MSLDEKPGTVPPEQEERESKLVERVVASFDATPDPRLKDLMQALTRHLHAFLREVRLTEEEWQRAIEFLTATGHITDDRRQEFILLSDILGASMQTIAINNEAYQNATEATVFGPFFVEGSPEIEPGGDIAAGASGEPCWVEGTVTDTFGQPVPHALIEVWEADRDGFYDVQYDDGRVAARGHLFSCPSRRVRPPPTAGTWETARGHACASISSCRQPRPRKPPLPAHKHHEERKRWPWPERR